MADTCGIGYNELLGNFNNDKAINDKKRPLGVDKQQWAVDRLLSMQPHIFVKTIDNHRGYTVGLENTKLSKFTASSMRKKPSTDKEKEISERGMKNADTGTFLHLLLEESVIKLSEGVDDAAVLAHLTTIAEEYPEYDSIGKHQTILDLAHYIIKDIQETQRRIDPTRQARILTEIKLVDPPNDVGGTADVVAIFSDGSARIYDYKSFSSNRYKQHATDSTTRRLVSDNVFTEQDRRNYVSQLSTLSSMLLNSGAVESVTGGRIVPIHFEYKLEYSTEEGRFVDSNKLEFIETPTTTRHLQQLVILLETISHDPKMNRLIQAQQVAIKQLERKVRRYGERLDEGERQRLKTLRRLTVILATYPSLEGYFDEAAGLFAEASSLADSPLVSIKQDRETLTKLMRVLPDLHILKDTLESLEDYIAVIEPEYSEEYIEALKAAMHNTRATAVGLQKKIELFRFRVIKNEAANADIFLETVGDNRIIVNPEGLIGRYIGTSGDLDNPMLQLLNKIKFESATEAEKNLEKVVQEIIAIDNKLRKEGHDAKSIAKALVDTEDGHLLREFDYSASTEEYKNLPAKDRLAWLQRYFKPADNYQEWYDENIARITEIVNFKFKAKEEAAAGNARELDRIATQKNQEINDWVYRHKLYNDDGTAASGAWSYYSDKLYRLQLTAEGKAKFTTQEFKDLATDPLLAEYYRTYKGIMEYLLETAGIRKRANDGTFLAYVRKDWLERMDDLGLNVGTFGSMAQAGLDNLTIQDDDVLFNQDANGDVIREVPIHFTNPFMTEDADGNPIEDLNEKSYDLTRSLQLFAQTVFTHRAFEKTESAALTIAEIMQSDRYAERKVSSSGHLVKSVAGVLQVDVKTDMDYVKSKIDEAWYQHHMQDTGFLNKSMTIGGRKYSLKKVLDKWKEYEIMKTLGLSIIPAAGSFLAAVANTAIEGLKGTVFNADDLHNSIKAHVYERERYLAFNYLMEVDSANSLESNMKRMKFPKGRFVSTIAEAGHQRKFRKWMSTKLFMSFWQIGEEWSNHSISTAMAFHYVVDRDGKMFHMKDSMIVNGELDPQYKRVWDIFSYNKEDNTYNLDGYTEEQKWDIVNKFRQAVFYQQKKIKGASSTRDKAYYQNFLIGTITFMYKNWMPGILKERFGAFRYSPSTDTFEMGRWRAFMSDVGGEEATPWTWTLHLMKNLSKLLVDATIIGRLIGNESTSLLASTKTEAYRHLAEKQAIELADNNPQLAHRLYDQETGELKLDEYIKIKQDQIRVLGVELFFVISLTLFISQFLKAGDDDDDPRNSYIGRKITQLLTKVKIEMSVFLDPQAFTKTMTGTTNVAIAGLFTDVFKVIGNGGDEIRDFVAGENSNSDKSPFLYYSRRFVPGHQLLKQVFEIFEEDQNYLLKY